MIGRLTRYELKKSLSGKFFRIALCLMLLLNLLLNCGVREWNEVQELLHENSSMGSSLSEREKTDFFAMMKSARHVLNVNRRHWRELTQLSEQEKASLETVLKEKYGEDVLERPMEELMPEMMGTVGSIPGSEQDDLSIIRNIQYPNQHNERVEQDIYRLLESAKRSGREAMKRNDNYNVRKSLRTLDLYETPRQKCAVTTVYGWNDLVQNSSTMLLVYLLVLLACAGSFADEKESQVLYLLHTAKNGKTKTLLAKYLSGAITAAGLTLVFQAVTCVAFTFCNVFMSWKEPVTILDGLELCPFRLTVGQYVLLTILGWMLCAVILSVILNTISALSKNSIISYGVGTVVLGVSIALASIKPRIEWFSGPLAFTWNSRFFESYYSANLFTFPLWWGLTLVIFWTIIGILCIVLADRVFHRKRRAL